jgi:tetratricopeptide (TPR) repeat protein
MRSSVANSRPFVFGATLATLVGAAFLLRPLEQALVRPGPSPMQSGAPGGSGGVLAVLGGFRSAVAGGFWLRANLAWEKQDAAATVALIQLTVATDGRPVYFWLNGARMLAYDLPEWRLDATAPAAIRQREGAEGARQALRLLEQGRRWHAAEPAFFIEMGNIHLRRTRDVESAARCYRQAAELPGAPHYAARIHGELLRELGRPAEALAWLRQVVAKLPADDPAARREVVEERIRALEQEVGAR